MEELISVVVPVYNGEKTIAICLDSLIAQTYSMIEIIVVNDGSVDGTESILEGYQKKDSRIVVCSQKNLGVSVARNNGVLKSTGKYITFVDADDMADKDYIETLLEKMNDEIDMVICRYYKAENERKKQSLEVNIYDKDYLLKQFFFFLNKGYINSLFCKLYRKEIIFKNRIQMPVELDIGEDLQFNLKYIQHVRKIVDYEKYIYHYKCENSYLTNKYYENMFEKRSYAIRGMKKFFESNEIKDDNYIFYLYVKLMYSDIMQMFGKKNKRERNKRVKVLLSKTELMEAIVGFKPNGFFQWIMHLGCKNKNIFIIEFVAALFYIFKMIFPNFKRVSV